MFAAPAADRAGVGADEERRRRLDVVEARPRPFLAADAAPELRQAVQDVVAVRLAEGAREAVGPRAPVPEVRLVREAARDLRGEVRAELARIGLVGNADEFADGGGIQRVDVGLAVVPAARLRDLDEVPHAPLAGAQRGARPREAAVGGDGLLGAGGVRRIVRRERRLGEPRERARAARGLLEVRVGDALEREVARAEAARRRDAPARGAAGPAVLVVHPRAHAGPAGLVDARADAVEPLAPEVFGGEAGAAVHEEAAEAHLAERADLRAAFVRIEPGVPRPEGRPAEVGAGFDEAREDRRNGLHGGEAEGV